MTLDTLKEYITTIDKTLLYKLGAALVLYVLFIMFLFMPSIRNYTEIKEKRSSNKRATAQALKSTERLSRLSQEKFELEMMLKEVNAMVASPQSVRDFLGEVSELATLCNVKIVEVMPVDVDAFQDGAIAEYCNAHAFQLDLETGYHQLGRFVEKIETHDKIMRIISLRMLPSPKSEKIHLTRIIFVVFSKKKDLLEGVA